MRSVQRVYVRAAKWLCHNAHIIKLFFIYTIIIFGDQKFNIIDFQLRNKHCVKKQCMEAKTHLSQMDLSGSSKNGQIIKII